MAAGRDNPFDMQIKLLMIGDSGNCFLTPMNDLSFHEYSFWSKFWL